MGTKKIQIKSGKKTGGFGSTVRYAPGVTKVRYRKIIYLKKPKIEPEKQQKKPK